MNYDNMSYDQLVTKYFVAMDTADKMYIIADENPSDENIELWKMAVAEQTVVRKAMWKAHREGR